MAVGFRRIDRFVSSSRQTLQVLALLWRERLGKLDVELDDDVALLVGLLGIGQALAGYALLGAGRDDLIELDLLLAAVESGHLDDGAEQ